MAYLPKVVPHTIEAMIPINWFKGTSGSSVWVAGYQICRVPNTSIPSGTLILDFNGVRAFFSYGTVTYLDSKAAKVQITEEGKLVIQATPELEKQSPPGAYLLLLAPFDVDGIPGNETATRQRISEVIGLLIAAESRNIAFTHLFDNVNELGKPERSVISPTIVNPFSLPIPDLTPAHLQDIVQIDARIFRAPGPVQNRVQLSLRWFEAATYDADVDAFLKHWIALETLAMPDTSDIRPISQSLAAVYELSMQEVGQRYHVGRLYDLRNRIVHDGFTTLIKSPLLEYIAAIYVDVLFQIIGKPCEKRAEKMIASQGFDPLAIIPVP